MDWDLTLALAAQSMQMERWIMGPLQVAPCLALCARALAEGRPETAGVLHGAAYAIFRRAASEAGSGERSSAALVGPNANFVLTAMHETGDDAITYALANIDPKLHTGPIASIDR